MILLKKDNTIVPILLGFVAFTMPFGLLSNINPISIILLTIYTLFLFVKKRKSILFNQNTIQWLPLIYFFFLAFTLTYADNLSGSVEQLEKNLSFLLFPILFLVLHKYLNDENKKKIAFSFIFGNIMALAVCLLCSIYEYYENSNFDAFLKGSFYFTDYLDLHPTYFSMYIVMSIAFIREYMRRNKTSRITLIVITLILWVSIIHLRSRSGIVALILVEIILLALAFLKKNKKINRVLFWTLLGAFIITLFTGTFNGRFYEYGKEYFKRDTNAAIDDRLKNWHASFEALSECPFLGNGLFDSSTIRDKYFFLNGYDVGIDRNYNSHNQFLETTLTGGILGLIVFLSMLINIFALFYNKGNPSILCFVIILLVNMMTESILVRQHGIVFFSFFYVFFNTRLNEK